MISDEKTQLSEYFGSYKAEWLKERLFELFTEPNYLPELLTARPCLLEGGRGTGKTTVLRCLSYKGQHMRCGGDEQALANMAFFGFYHRVNTNRVTAFQGPEVEGLQWKRLFAHYVNLELCGKVLEFLLWYETQTGCVALGQQACESVAWSFHLDAADNVTELAGIVQKSKIRFEAYINNILDAPQPNLTLQGAPLDNLMKLVYESDQFKDKLFFFLLDEYENYLDYQQQVVNTLIKHAGEHYTFKFGVRELGWRVHTTLNENEVLMSPADFVRININQKLGGRFPEFAKKVCNMRLSHITVDDRPLQMSVTELLPTLSEDVEADLLGVNDRLQDYSTELSNLTPEQLRQWREVRPLDAYVVCWWAESRGDNILQTVLEYLSRSAEWSPRIDNYRYAALFTLRQGRRGISKYYSGWGVFTHLANGNIRYVLELLEQSLVKHLEGGGSLSTPVSYPAQTLAAQEVGKKNLGELEGLVENGVRLTKLLLGLGRVFQVMARQAGGHAPEVNQFRLVERHTRQDDASPAKASTEVEQLLRNGVMHLALVRYSGNKLQSDADTVDFHYMMHPLFSAFFGYSHRRKRNMTLTQDDIVGLTDNPRATIEKILKDKKRHPEEPLPDQLDLFEGYYAGRA